MSVYVRFGITASVSSTSSEEKDLGSFVSEVLDPTQNEGGSRKVTLLGSAVDAQIALCDIADAKFLILKTEPKDPNDDGAEVKIRLNSPTGEEISVKPLGTGKAGYFLITTTGLTALYATNTGAEDMYLTIVIAGD